MSTKVLAKVNIEDIIRNFEQYLKLYFTTNHFRKHIILNSKKLNNNIFNKKSDKKTEC